jgi:plasmid stability protein
VKNITISIPDDVYRQARVFAAEDGTSVSAIVADYLRSLTERDKDFARLATKQTEIVAGIERFSARDRLDRDQLHDRAVS